MAIINAECRVRSIDFLNHIELLTQTTAVDCISVWLWSTYMMT